MSILDVSFQSLVVMIEHGTSLIIEPGVMMRISWHTTPKWTRPMSRSKIQTRCHFLHSSCSEIEGFPVVEFKAKFLNSSSVVFTLVWYVMKFSSSRLALLSGICRVRSWHTTLKWTRPMSRSKIQTRCHFLHSSCSEIEGFRLLSLKPNHHSWLYQQGYAM